MDCPAEDRVPVLLASSRESDLAVIDGLLRGTRYVVVPAANLNHASKLLSHVVFPIILYDRFFHGSDWQPTLWRLIGAWRVPSVLLLSDVRDRDFWEEAVCRGVFDVLARPFHGDDLLAVLEFAYAHWQLGLTQRPSFRNLPRLSPVTGAE